LLIWYLENKSTLNTEVAIGVIFTGALAIGTLITPSEDLIEALFGGFRSLTLVWFVLGVLSVVLIVGLIYHFRHGLIISLFSPELAATSGINCARLNLYYILTFSLTVLLGLRFLGALLAGALIILPAAIGRQLASSLTGFLVASSVASVISVLAGIAFAFLVPTINIGAMTVAIQPGPAVITVAAILFLLTLLKKSR
ncbi:MAG: metal ABC transporter permease, partial [Blastocatellia bacterium]